MQDKRFKTDEKIPLYPPLPHPESIREGVRGDFMNVKNIKRINLPLTKEDVLSLHTSDIVLINGQIVTGRDKLHKFLFNKKPSKKQIPFNLKGTILYHCGPIIKKTTKGFELIAGGPTTSMRIEMYEHRLT